VAVSPRLGRNNQKEQYAIYYRAARVQLLVGALMLHSMSGPDPHFFQLWILTGTVLNEVFNFFESRACCFGAGTARSHINF
jgi:hypothetical protein